MANAYYSIIEPIIFTASRLEVIANRSLFRPIGMNISSVKILNLLCKKKLMTPKEIMQLAGGTKSNISQRLDSLEKRGYIKTQKNIFDDKRKMSVKLTLAGRKKLQEIKDKFEQVKLGLEANFDRKEILQHFAFFDKLNKIIDSEEKNLTKYKFFCK
jgi:DNA-binding MarR family transcriptional regulator